MRRLFASGALVLAAACGSGSEGSDGTDDVTVYRVSIVNFGGSTATDTTHTYRALVTVTDPPATIQLAGRSIRVQATGGDLETPSVVTDEDGLATIVWTVRTVPTIQDTLSVCSTNPADAECSYVQLIPAP